ncbi:MAG TPA: hypothetical protein PLY05_14140, partial [Agitococcus sp.]|nr:hypothetical protein [Agitococcus sp.]
GILKIHQSMSDKDIPAEALRSIKAYHGSPAMFDKFMREFVNSGEGAQAFGWGHYFAGRKALAEWYRTVLSNDFNRTSFVFRKDGERVRLTDLYTPKSEWEKVNEDELVELFKKYLLGKQGERGKTWQADTDPRYDALAEIAKDLSQYNKDTIGYAELKAVQQVMQKYKSKQFSAQRVSTAHNKTGQLYEVDIAAKEESFLDWFTKFDDLSPAEQKSLAKVFKEFDAYGDLDATDKTIGQLYQKVTRYSQDGTPKRLSLALQDLGYSGIKFLDQESRKNPYEKQYFNYVVFDENIISIKDTYYSKQQGATEGFYLNGTVHLIADNLTDETIIPTFVHELGGHKGFQEMMSPKAYELIMQQFDRLVAQGNAIAIKA